MPIKDQCQGCKLYNNATCPHGGLPSVYDGSSCESYIKAGINLEKTDSHPLNENPQNVIIDDGISANKHSFLKHLFSFKGRIRRLEYNLTLLAYYIYCLPVEILEEDEISAGFAIIWLLLLIPACWIFIAQSAKRCHDRDNSGWYQLIPFYPWVMMFGEGDSGRNSYGEDPKA